MHTKIMKWVAITALVLAVTLLPSANYQLPLGFVVCAGAIMLVLALFSFKRRFETRHDVVKRPHLRGSGSL